MLHEVYHFGKVIKTSYDEYTFNKGIKFFTFPIFILLKNRINQLLNML